MSKQCEDEMEAINRVASCVTIDQPAISFWRTCEKDFRRHPWQPDPAINSKTISAWCYRHSLHSQHSHSGSADSSKVNQTVLAGNISVYFEIRKARPDAPDSHCGQRWSNMLRRFTTISLHRLVYGPASVECSSPGMQYPGGSAPAFRRSSSWFSCCSAR